MSCFITPAFGGSTPSSFFFLGVVAHAIVSASVALARSMGLRSVAEGVETREIAATLAQIGVDAMQGYFFARPQSLDATLDWAAHGCRTAGIGCLDCKAKLAEHMLEKLKDIHARRPEFEKRPDLVWDVLLDGSRRAREVAEATMEDVRSAMKIRYDRS